MRKLVGIFIATLLIGTAVLPVANSYEKNFFDYNLNEESTDDCKCMSYIDSIRGRLYVMSDPLTPPSNIEDYIMPSSKVDLPEYFNWKDHNGSDWTTPARDQGNCGSCWAFAAMGALESVINIREGIPNLDIDLSEQYILSCLPDAANNYGEGCRGGQPYNTFDCIINTSERGNYCNGIIPELCFPYQANHNIPCSDKCENWQEVLIPISNLSELSAPSWLDRDLNIVKTAIIEWGPVASFINVTQDFGEWGSLNHNPTDYYPWSNVGPYRGCNHVIVIVGWKDDPSIANGGYWICKNSWGKNWGYDGFFNIEYGGFFTGYWSATVDYDPEDFDWYPVPKPNGPYYGMVNEPVQLQGNAAGEHPPFTWHWDFGDGEISEEQNPSHIYTNPGDYVVTLTVSDSNDNVYSVKTSAWVQETNTPPNTPTIEGPTKVKPGEYCWYNISTVDPDGTHYYIYSIVYDIDWGIWWGPIEPGEMDRYYGNWSEEGEYIVKAKAKDPYGAESDWATLEVTVLKNKVRSQIDFIMERLIQRFPILEFLL